MSNYPKLVETVKEKGALAFHSGLPVESCPYRIATKQGRKFKRLWLAGYCEARDNHPTAAEVMSNGITNR